MKIIISAFQDKNTEFQNKLTTQRMSNILKELGYDSEMVLTVYNKENKKEIQFIVESEDRDLEVLFKLAKQFKQECIVRIDNDQVAALYIDGSEDYRGSWIKTDKKSCIDKDVYTITSSLEYYSYGA